MKTLLVGMYFRPPAKQIVEVLPAGTKLQLSPETDNPFDEYAIQVLVRASQVPESQHEFLREILPSCGEDWDELLAEDKVIHLGYIAASGGKPLQKAGLDFGNREVLDFMGSHSNWIAELGFLEDGKPTVELSVGEEE